MREGGGGRVVGARHAGPAEPGGSQMSTALTGAAARAADSVAAQLDGMAPLGVAFSGGVDSASLLALAVRALGADGVVAILGVSPSLAADEREGAHRTAAAIGARVVEIETFEGD